LNSVASSVAQLLTPFSRCEAGAVMRNDGSDLLFSNHSMHDVMRAHQQQAIGAPSNLNDDRLLNTPTEDLVDQIWERWRLDIPDLDAENAVLDHNEGDVQVYDTYQSFGGRGPATIRGSILELTVPFTGDRDFFFIQPTQFNMSPPRASVGRDQLSFKDSSREVDSQQAEAALKKVLADIELHLTWHRQSAAPFNEQLRGQIRGAVEERKVKVLRDRNSLANMGFQLKSRSDAPKTYIAPVKRSAVAVKASHAPRGTAPFKPEPALDDETYSQILNIMENMAHVMERSPSAFVGMGEEALRQHFLVQLNGQFEGAATGETFNFEGKTDILIRVEDRNIFIAECKFWGGEKAFLETIDQLLGYLSWRDTKTAVVFFNRNRDFSNVLKTILEAAEKHPQKKRGPTKEGETRFKYVFGNPKDANRELFLTVMAFDVPKPETVRSNN
jgi:hypothetical protein